VEVSTLSLFHRKTYSKRAKILAEPRVSVEDQPFGKTTIEFEDHVHLEEPIPEVTPCSSSSSEDDTSRYIILVRKQSTRLQNKFRLKSKVVNKPAITNKVIIIDEEPVKHIGKTSIRKKNPVTNPEKDKSKKGGLIINKRQSLGKTKFLLGNKVKRI
jgi:hypothetical protein